MTLSFSAFMPGARSLAAALTALALALPAVAQAQLLNGSFETALSASDWNAQGDAATRPSALAVQGTQLLWLSTEATTDPDGLNHSGAEPLLAGGGPGSLEAALGLNGGDLDSPASFAVEGSAAWQRFSAAAGSQLQLSWNFFSLGDGSVADYDDQAYLLLDGQRHLLASASGTAASGALAGWGRATGWQSATFTLTGTGLHTLAFVVTDQGDAVEASALAVDHVTLTSSVPEPSTLALFLLGGLGVMAQRRRR